MYFYKSEAMGVDIPSTLLQTLRSNFKIRWTDSALSYLGTYIPSRLSRIFEPNFPPLLSKKCTFLVTWHQGLHSWFGRCKLLKIYILPKYLYRFQALLIKIPLHYFKQVNSLFIIFIWAHKRPCLPCHQLSLPKQYWGLADPDVLPGNISTNLGRFIDWCCHYDIKLWAQIEQAQTDMPLKSALWYYEALSYALKMYPR